MRIALVAPLVVPLRATHVGGAQAVLADLARGLAAQGETVEVVAAPGSRIPGVRVRATFGGPFPEALVHMHSDPTAGAWPSLQATAYLNVAATLRDEAPDVIHAHALDWPAFYALGAAGLPTVHTLHLGPVDPAAAQAARAAAHTRRRPRFVAVSEACAAQWRPILRVDAVIGNGVDPSAVAFSARPELDLALIAGRIAPEKGTHLAVTAARQAGMRVLLVGDVYDRTYFDEAVAPLLGPAVEHRGPVPRRHLARLYGKAAVAVVASLWEEPFGMVAVEANLAGTPVAGFAKGALPEVVGSDGGVLTDDLTVKGLSRAIRQAAGTDRRAARDAAVRRHPLDRMVERYRALYRQLSPHDR